MTALVRSNFFAVHTLLRRESDDAATESIIEQRGRTNRPLFVLGLSEVELDINEIRTDLGQALEELRQLALGVAVAHLALALLGIVLLVAVMLFTRNRGDYERSRDDTN